MEVFVCANATYICDYRESVIGVLFVDNIKIWSDYRHSDVKYYSLYNDQ